MLGDEEFGRTRGETATINKDEDSNEATTPNKIKRTTTMAQTAEVVSHLNYSLLTIIT